MPGERVRVADGSRVYRQVVTMEVVWIVGPDWTPEHEHEHERGRPKLDGEAVVRDAVMAADEGRGVWPVAGYAHATEPVELTP
jgi:hypothetical protein